MVHEGVHRHHDTQEEGIHYGVCVIKMEGQVVVSELNKKCSPVKTNGWNLKKADWKRKNIYPNHPIFLGVQNVRYRSYVKLPYF